MVETADRVHEVWYLLADHWQIEFVPVKYKKNQIPNILVKENAMNWTTQKDWNCILKSLATLHSKQNFSTKIQDAFSMATFS